MISLKFDDLRDDVAIFPYKRAPKNDVYVQALSRDFNKNEIPTDVKIEKKNDMNDLAIVRRHQASCQFANASKTKTTQCKSLTLKRKKVIYNLAVV